MMNKYTLGEIAWKKHLGRQTAKRKAANKLAKKTRKAQRRAVN